MTWDTRKFLVVVKTYPNPSAKSREAVCTAAVDENGTLVRLFPIPFRTLADNQKFKKWQWIKVRVEKSSDPRRESFKVDATSIEPLEEVPAGKHWQRRWSLVEHLVSESQEQVDASGASLGLIRPLSYSMTFKDKKHPTWTTVEVEKLIGLGPVDMFGNAVTPRTLLQKIPVEIRYRFSCDGSCSHHQLFEDWEACESWRSWAARYHHSRPMLEAAMINEYVDEPAAKSNLFLWIGTHARWREWLVIGHARPENLSRALPLPFNMSGSHQEH